MNFNIAFFDTKPYDRESFDSRFNDFEGLTVKYFDVRLMADTVSLANGFDCVVVFVNDDLSSDVIDKLCEYNVKLIALRCAGYNNVDLKTANGKIQVVRVPAYSPYAVAEHAFAMLLTLVRKTHKAYVRSRDFNFNLKGLTGFELHGKTAGIIGTGRIGKVFINIAKGFGMNVIAYDAYPTDSQSIKYVDLDELLRNSDIVSLHCPLTPDTMHIINKDKISLMKNGAIIINTSRGALINAEDLLEAIKAKKLGGACLDVYEEETDVFFEDNSSDIIQDDVLARLISMPNILVTSHQAFLTNEALHNIAETTVKNIVDYLYDGVCTNAVLQAKPSSPA